MAIDEMSDRFEINDVLKLLEDRKAQLFVFMETKPLAACVTTIEGTQSHKWLRVMWGGGSELNKWKHLLAGIEQWAKSLGCERSVIYGRKGWVKALSDYKQTAVILEKVI